jgi:hypothetical protein
VASWKRELMIFFPSTWLATLLVYFVVKKRLKHGSPPTVHLRPRTRRFLTDIDRPETSIVKEEIFPISTYVDGH